MGYNTPKSRSRNIIALHSRSGTAKNVAKDYSVSREILYNWKNGLLGKESRTTLLEKNDHHIADNKEVLSEIEPLQKQIHRLNLGNYVLEATEKM